MNWGEIRSAAWNALNTRLFEIGGTPISVATLVTVLAILVATFITSHLLQRAVRQGFKFRAGHREGTVRAVSRLLHYVAMLVGFGIALQTIGVDLGALFAAGAIFAVGIGFAMQSIAQNFVAGVILLVERSIKPGDVLGVEGIIVKVVEMGIRATIVETRDGENLIVPNSILIQSTVKNYTLADSAFRVCVSVGVVYDSNMAAVRTTLDDVAAAVSAKWGVKDRPPLIAMTGFGDHAVNFEVGVWMNDPWNFRPAMSELNEAVWWAFKKQGIVIAFPQLDLHLDSAALQALSQASGRSEAASSEPRVQSHEAPSRP